MIKVAKFGGSSVADARAMRLAANAMGKDCSVKVVAVSAGGKTAENRKITDELYTACERLKNGEAFFKAFSKITDRLSGLLNDLKLKFNIYEELTKIGREAENALSPDFLVSRGEYLYSKIFAALTDKKFVDCADMIKFGLNGGLDIGFSEIMIKELLSEYGGFVTGGFYGADYLGKIRLLPRGGGDVTGAILARALNAESYLNFTDVNGVLPLPPALVGKLYFNVKPLKVVSYDIMERLCDFSVNVLHEDTLKVLKGTGINIEVKNTFNELSEGTVVSEKCRNSVEFALAVETWEIVKRKLERKRDVKVYCEILKNANDLKDDDLLCYLTPCDKAEKLLSRIKKASSCLSVSTDDGIVFVIEKKGLLLDNLQNLIW